MATEMHAYTGREIGLAAPGAIPEETKFYKEDDVRGIIGALEKRIANLEAYPRPDNSTVIATLIEKNKDLEGELAKAKATISSKGTTIVRLECEKRDLWLRFVQLRRALCRLRAGFALHFGRVNSGKKIVAYWKRRCKTAPYWDSKTYKDIPQTPTEKKL